MKKLLLTLGAVASVAAPVAAVVACSSNDSKTTTWESLATRYQSFNLMAWSDTSKTLHLTSAKDGSPFQYKSATVFTEAEVKDHTNDVQLTNSDEDKAKLALIKPKVKELLEDASKLFAAQLKKIVLDKQHLTSFEAAAEKAMIDIQSLIDGNKHYAKVETSLNNDLQNILVASNIKDHDELETTNGIKVITGVTLKDGEKDLITHLPLILKLAKTLDAISTLA